ncbi:MAG: cell division protein ZapA [Clostridia bacterium]|nr:cell division protein ZapA [Clostridia bacterium]
MAEKYKLIIGGTEIKVFTDESEEYVNALAGELNERITKLMINNPRCTKLDSLILSALDILDDKKKLENEIVRLEKENEFLRKRIH